MKSHELAGGEQRSGHNFTSSYDLTEFNAAKARLANVMAGILDRGEAPDIRQEDLSSKAGANSSWLFNREPYSTRVIKMAMPDSWIISNGVFKPTPGRIGGGWGMFGSNDYDAAGPNKWQGIVVDANCNLYDCSIICTKQPYNGILDILANTKSRPAELIRMEPFVEVINFNHQADVDMLVQNIADFEARMAIK